MDNLTEHDVYKALTYLGETDVEFARAKASIEWSAHQAKTVYSMELLASDQATVEGRKAGAQASETYQDAMQRVREAVYDYQLLSAKRKRAELTIDVWRSLNAARGRGVVQ